MSNASRKVYMTARNVFRPKELSVRTHDGPESCYDDYGGDEQSEKRIENGTSGGEYQNSGDYGKERNQSIAEIVNVRQTNRRVFLAWYSQHLSNAPVRRGADQARHDRHSSEDFHRVGQTLDDTYNKEGGDRQKSDRVEKIRIAQQPPG